MDHKKSPNRTKRQAKVLEDSYWDCSVCTYRNTAEAFKCLMCDVRKGTSTRKPRINPQLVAQQFNPAPPVKAPKREGSSGSVPREKTSRRRGGGASRRPWPRLKNIDRSSGQTREITVNNVTVVITEYKAKKKKTACDSASSEGSHTDTEQRSADLASDSRSS